MGRVALDVWAMRSIICCLDRILAGALGRKHDRVSAVIDRHRDVADFGPGQVGDVIIIRASASPPPPAPYWRARAITF